MDGDRADDVPSDGLTPRSRPEVTILLRVLVALALFYTLYLAAPVLVPFTAAVLLAFTLAPVVRVLERLHVPTALAAGLVLLAGVAGIGVALVGISAPATAWFEDAPARLQAVRSKLHKFTDPVAAVKETSEDVERLAQDIGAGSDGGPDDVVQVEIKQESFLDAALSATPQFFATAVAVVFFLYFLLAAGSRVTTKVSRLAPNWAEAVEIAEVAQSVQRQVSRYLLTISATNLLLGLATGLWLNWMGVDNAFFWGVVAGALNFAPYVGAFIVTVLIALVALLQFSEPGTVITTVAGFVFLTALEGQLVTPLVVGRRLALSPYVVFVGIMVLGWLWGVAGALMAVPIMVCLRIICGHVEGLNWIAILLAREEPQPAVDEAAVPG